MDRQNGVKALAVGFCKPCDVRRALMHRAANHTSKNKIKEGMDHGIGPIESTRRRRQRNRSPNTSSKAGSSVIPLNKERRALWPTDS